MIHPGFLFVNRIFPKDADFVIFARTFAGLLRIFVGFYE